MSMMATLLSLLPYAFQASLLPSGLPAGWVAVSKSSPYVSRSVGCALPFSQYSPGSADVSKAMAWPSGEKAGGLSDGEVPSSSWYSLPSRRISPSVLANGPSASVRELKTLRLGLAGHHQEWFSSRSGV